MIEFALSDRITWSLQTKRHPNRLEWRLPEACFLASTITIIRTVSELTKERLS